MIQQGPSRASSATATPVRRNNEQRCDESQCGPVLCQLEEALPTTAGAFLDGAVPNSQPPEQNAVRLSFRRRESKPSARQQRLGDRRRNSQQSRRSPGSAFVGAVGECSSCQNRYSGALSVEPVVADPALLSDRRAAIRLAACTSERSTSITVFCLSSKTV